MLLRSPCMPQRVPRSALRSCQPPRQQFSITVPRNTRPFSSQPNNGVNPYDIRTPLYPNHVETSFLLKGMLAVGAGVMGLIDPMRTDMVAILGETTGHMALRRIHHLMQANPVGREILATKPRVSEETLNFPALRALPAGTFGKAYVDWMDGHGFSPNERDPVRLIDDIELAYVMTRYRESHDFWHVLLGLNTDVLSEIAVKWVEMVQTGLPVCALSAFVGPLRLTHEERVKLATEVVPWALKVGKSAVFLMNAYPEKHLAEPIADVRRLLRITTPTWSLPPAEKAMYNSNRVNGPPQV